MDDVLNLDSLRVAANRCPTTFQEIPDAPIEVGDPALLGTEAEEIIARYERNGFAIVQLTAAACGPEALLALSDSLELGEPFVPPLYSAGGYIGSALSRITTDSNGDDPAHPTFGSAVGLELHCDGTLQPIGFVRTSALLCETPAPHGGESTLFNTAGAFRRLLALDPRAASALASPQVLVRQANMNGCVDENIGPAVAVVEDELACCYAETDTDRWNPCREIADDLARALAFLRAAARLGSPDFVQLTLAPRQVILMANTRISHGRTPYTNDPEQRRCLYRGLFLRAPSLSAAPARRAESPAGVPAS